MRSPRSDLGSVGRSYGKTRFWLHIQRTFLSELFANGTGSLEVSERSTGVVPAEPGRLAIGFDIEGWLP